MNVLQVSVLLGACALAGCAGFSEDGGFEPVARAAHERLGREVRWTRTADERAKNEREVAALLARPLSVDDAVQIALLNNAGLQASFEELGVSEADVVQSGRLPNPRITFRRTSAGGESDIEEALSVNILSLLAAPYAHAIEKRRFAAAQANALADVARLAERTRYVYFTALAARESARYSLEAESAAQSSAELGKRMQDAGNWSRLDAERERGFFQEAEVDATRTQLAERIARENLFALLGASGDAARVQLADRLPDLPAGTEALPPIDSVLAVRVDLAMMRARMDALARNLHLTKATRFVNVLEAGPARVRQGADSAPFESGYEVTLEVPIFDGGSARVRKAEALYAQSVGLFTQAAVAARAEVQSAYAQYLAAYAIARRERDELVPLRKSITAEDLRRYNAAQISVFDLLADVRAEIHGVNGYIESVRDFWIAKSTLDAASLGSPQEH